MPQVAREVVKERARRLREKGAAALRRHLDSEIGERRRVLVEIRGSMGAPSSSRRCGWPAFKPGEVHDLIVAGHDGVTLAGGVIATAPRRKTMSTNGSNGKPTSSPPWPSSRRSIRSRSTVRRMVKETDRITTAYRALVEASPFCALATNGPDGLDCSPRGDPAGFVRVIDENTIAIPDRRGNNRIDCLRNLIDDPRVALLFLIPGVSETLRIMGRATISTDPELCASFTMQGKAPRWVLVVAVERVFFQCAKAIVRSKLWDPATKVERSSLPTAGTILAEITDGKIGGPEHDRAYRSGSRRRSTRAWGLMHRPYERDAHYRAFRTVQL